MDEIKKKENIQDIKRRTYLFSLDIIKLVNLLPNKTLGRVITDQLLRSATSVSANLVEAKAASSRKDFIRFYQYSLKSINETSHWLNLIRDSNLINSNEIEILIQEADEIAKILASIIIKLKNHEKTK